MSIAVVEPIWIRRLLTEFGFAEDVPVKVFCDSKAAIQITKNSMFHERKKHKELDCHFIC